MLLVYYNLNHCSFYQVYRDFTYEHLKVGYVNGFGHILVQIFYFENKKIYNVQSEEECYFIKSRLTKKYVIKRLIRFLNKRLLK